MTKAILPLFNVSTYVILNASDKFHIRTALTTEFLFAHRVTSGTKWPFPLLNFYFFYLLPCLQIMTIIFLLLLKI